MDPDNPTVTSERPPPLNSDQLNYLIWRYLQEAGYGEAAVKLQRDWNVDAENLPFANHIKGRALISLVQKGLRYHHLSLTIDEQGRPARELNPSLFFFGPESGKPIQEVRDNARPSSAGAQPSSPSSIVPLKRDAVPNGAPESYTQPAPKKSRKNAGGHSERNGSVGRKPAPTSSTLVTNIELNAPNGHPPGRDIRSPSTTEPPGPEDIAAAINGVHGDDRMDVDTDGEPQVEALPEPVILHTLVNGESRAVQVEPAKVADLAPSTTILGLDQTSLSQVLWHPTDPTILTGRGDTLCGVWRTSAFTQNTSTSFQDLVRFPSSDENCVTAIAWEPQGQILAVAVSTPAGGEVQLYAGKDLGLLETLSASQRMIMRLQWQQDGRRLVGLAPMNDENSESSILLWDMSITTQSAAPHCVTVPETLEDIDCAMYENQAVVCASGGRAVYHLRAYAELEVEQKWSSGSAADTENWTFVKCAWQSMNDSLIVAASNESGRVWLPAHDLSHQAHQAPITSLQIRPRTSAGRPSLSTNEFATCSVDGTIKAWTFNEAQKNLTTLCKLTLGHSQPLKALSYSPDGFCLTGASYGDVRIWNAEHRYNLMASWQAPTSDWGGNAIKDRDLVSNDGVSSLNGDIGPIEHSLSCDSDSMKVAFSLASQVAIINFQR